MSFVSIQLSSLFVYQLFFSFSSHFLNSSLSSLTFSFPLPLPLPALPSPTCFSVNFPLALSLSCLLSIIILHFFFFSSCSSDQIFFSFSSRVLTTSFSLLISYFFSTPSVNRLSSQFSSHVFNFNTSLSLLVFSLFLTPVTSPPPLHQSLYFIHQQASYLLSSFIFTLPLTRFSFNFTLAFLPPLFPL